MTNTQTVCGKNPQAVCAFLKQFSFYCFSPTINTEPKIKVLKRNAYGFTNFNRFRNRILHIFSHQNQKQMAT
mgnify:CR=1 FL=1